MLYLVEISYLCAYMTSRYLQYLGMVSLLTLLLDILVYLKLRHERFLLKYDVYVRAFSYSVSL